MNTTITRPAAATATNITTSEPTSSVMLPTVIASCCRNIWISVMSDVARDMMSPAAQRVAPGGVEVLQVVVHGDLQVALHVDRGAPAEPAAAVVGDEAEDADDEQEGDPHGGERSSERIVSSRITFCTSGTQGEQQLADDRQADGDEQRPPMMAEERAEVGGHRPLPAPRRSTVG